MADRFYAEMKIEEALRLDPRVREVLASHGMDCQGCMEAQHGTLALGSRLHQVDLQPILDELNALD